jgi:O-antigen ligase
MKSKHKAVILLFVSLVFNYLLRVPWLIDEFLVSRFLLISVCCAVGSVWFLWNEKNLKLQVLDLVLIGFYLLNLVSIAWAPNFGEATFTSQRYLLLLVMYLIFRSILAEPSVTKPLSWMLTTVAILALVITGLQFAKVASDQGITADSIYLINGHSGHKNLVSSFLFLVLGLQVYFMAAKRPAWWEYVLLALVVILIFALRTRAVYLALVVFAACGGAYLFSQSAFFKQKITRRVLFFGIGTLLVGAVAIGATGKGGEYLRYLNPASFASSVSGTERLFVWSRTLLHVKEKPVLGYGTGNWKLIFPSKSISGGFRLQEQDVVFTRAHNDFLEVLTEVGFVGLGLFLAIFGVSIWLLVRVMRGGEKPFALQAVVLLATLLGYLIISFFDFPKERIEHQTLLALILALTAGMAAPYLRPGRGIFTLPDNGRKWLVGGLLAAQLISLPVGYHHYIGDRNSRIMIAAMTKKMPDRLRTSAQEAHSVWYSVNPLVIPVKWYEGLSYYFEKNFQEAAYALEEAYEINPYNFNVINNYASTLIQLKQYEKGAELYLKALEINPKFEEAMFNLAFAYYNLGKFDEAEAWVNRTQKNPKKKALFLENIEMGRNP